MIDLLLKKAAPQYDQEHLDIAVNDGVIVDCANNLDYDARQIIDLDGRLLIPGFIEPHIHLDIALSNPWDTPGRQESYQSMSELSLATERRRETFTKEDIVERASAAIELAVHHGVIAMRAQCHVDTQVELKHLNALLDVKSKYQDQVTLQIVVFPQQGLFRNPGTLELIREAFQAGADVMGGAPNLDVYPSGKYEFQMHVDRLFDLAMEFDVDLDIHADLDISKSVALDELEIVYIAQKTIENGYLDRVTVGHACALGSATPNVAQRAIEWLREAEIHVVSQPDLYRLGREDTHNVRRGLTRVKELLAAGVNVTYASNNVRDTFRPMGNFDPLEEALILSYGAHMDTVDEFDALMKMSTHNAATALRLDGYGLELGCNADMVVLDAPSPSAAVIGQVEKNYVFKGGRLLASSRVVSDWYTPKMSKEKMNE